MHKPNHILIAASGGSDSLALMHQLADQFDPSSLSVATVDHQLRAESQDEAAQVGQMAGNLSLKHTTLRWDSTGTQSASSARQARYALLAEHAHTIGADTIALGHTLNDQAETLVMRACRANGESSTRGMSGMSEWASYDNIKLWRPLLSATREELRANLKQKDVEWINDPSNQNLNSERVRVRMALRDSKSGLPDISSIARLAELSARSRHWLSRQTAQALNNHAASSHDGAFTFTPAPSTPMPIVLDALSLLILMAGGLPYRTALNKVSDAALALQTGQRLKTTVGRCLIRTKDHSIAITRENRNIPPLPTEANLTTKFDGKFIVQTGSEGHIVDQKPYILALERFRQSIDDPVYEAAMRLAANLKI